nr:hypothetical protein [Methylacidiphilum kamchatkense]
MIEIVKTGKMTNPPPKNTPSLPSNNVAESTQNPTRQEEARKNDGLLPGLEGAPA